MSELKSILLHLDASAAAARRVAPAQALAAMLGAGVEALYAVMPTVEQYPLAYAADSGLAALLVATESQTRDAARAAFDRACAAAGATEITWNAGEGDPLAVFGHRAYAADLLLLGQHEPQTATASGVPADFAASVLVATGKPALVLPYIEIAPRWGSRVMVAWKPTPESARAVTAALPLLRRAQVVHLVSWAETADAAHDPVAPIREYLRRHAVEAVVHAGPPTGREQGELGDLLLSQAADLQADLLVMGCYGHGRAREWVLGGVTRTVLRSMTLPVLMAH